MDGRNTGMKEAELYAPVRDYLAAQGYHVRGEVHHCDLAATRNGATIIVELKRVLNVDLLAQAVHRQRVSPSVYVAVPRPSGKENSPRWRGLRRLLRQLEVGLIWVSFHGAQPHVEVVAHPLPFDRKRSRRAERALIEEVENRSVDTPGGVRGKPLLTAYREHALLIALALERHGPQSPKALRAMGAGPKTQSILYNNVYGWFQRTGRGVYALKPAGASALESYASLLPALEARLTAPASKDNPQV